MPKRTDLESILILGAGPIVIGQACEFDYSGVQACRALREEGYRVVLVNSNPATVMTDPDMADATYIEPVDWRVVQQIIKRERVDAILPTMGGQTALNCALDLVREGVLEEHGVELIGAGKEAIDKAEDRQLFDQAMRTIGLETPRSCFAHSVEEALQLVDQIGFPVVVRPSFTLGGSGGGIAYNREQFITICEQGCQLSPTGELLIDEALLGWKEFELEVVRDRVDNCIIVCSIENLDPMGVHTGDSITVAPAQTLSDKEFQRMRDAAIAVLREIGIETGGSNVQFGVDPATGRQVVIEVNPRVSRSSALASKATGFPIARVATKLAVGYTLDELRNEITGGRTPASFEPVLDYVVTKLPRFAFEKFAGADNLLGTQMKSVGEVMAIGRSFEESLHKAMRALETGATGLDPQLELGAPDAEDRLAAALRQSTPDRIWYVADAFRAGMTVDAVMQLSGIDPWFLRAVESLVEDEHSLAGCDVGALDATRWRYLKSRGFSDQRLAVLLGSDEGAVRARRLAHGVRAVFKRVDSCAAEFPAETAYLYSCYEGDCESAPDHSRPGIVVLGGGPNRIGQGIEFDYCCVHAALACREDGYRAIMVNCNPETVSTDFDISDSLYFEPVTLEDVLAIVDAERPQGVIVQFGGQTPLQLCRALERAGVPIIGTSPDAIDRAENRQRFQHLIDEIGLLQPANAIAGNTDEAVAAAQRIAYPLVVRPSYVLGGRAMEVVHDEADLRRYMAASSAVSHESPILLDRFLDHAIEVDVDGISDGSEVIIGGLMRHIEQAGVHSGDSACSLPPHDLSEDLQHRMREIVVQLALELGVVGLVNAQLAVQDEQIYVLEVNPRASRTVPFVSKSIGYSMAAVAARCMLGQSLAEQRLPRDASPPCCMVKEAVLPFRKFPGADPILGPEMRSTGEVMGIGADFPEAFAKAQLAAGERLPPAPDGTLPAPLAFISVREADRPQVVGLARRLAALGFRLSATHGTAGILAAAGLEVRAVNKVQAGHPHVVDAIVNGEVAFLVNTTEGRRSIEDSALIRRAALRHEIYCTTTLDAAEAVAQVLEAGVDPCREVRCLQHLHGTAGTSG